MKQQIERWGIFELVLQGPSGGNPFLDVKLSATFKYMNRTLSPEGFYDGNGVYKVRFMPDTVGEWTYITLSTVQELDGISGEFTCVEPTEGNHGPVRVKNRYHFAYEDGTPHFSFGTTCYVWNHQSQGLQEQTLESLKAAPFNKIRMCLFPKHYDYNHNEPEHFVFPGSLADGWDFLRFDTEYFAALEQQLIQLQQLGIEADLILFHPYDRWGFSRMNAETDDFYLRYTVARLAAFRNIWWSIANEHEFLKEKQMEDWDRMFKIVQENDPYQHLRSIHNWAVFYDYNKPWVTHCSIQHPELLLTKEWREQYRKPVVVDECRYEGDINHDWGNITAEDMVRRFWDGMVRGGYVGHGETYVGHKGKNEGLDEVLWWSHGGKLHGSSPERINFLRRIIEEGPVGGLNPVPMSMLDGGAGEPGEYYLYYYGSQRPAFKILDLPNDREFSIEVIDSWNMTITPLEGTYSGKFRLELPGKQYIALRIQRR